MTPNYNPNGGMLPLRRAIVDKLVAENGIAAEVEQVWVTVGGTQALHLAMQLHARSRATRFSCPTRATRPSR